MEKLKKLLTFESYENNCEGCDGDGAILTECRGCEDGKKFDDNNKLYKRD